MQLYVDLDGVLADFDTGYELAFGVRPSRDNDDIDWKQVAQKPTFYFDLPPMPDLPALWARISRYDPIILTGLPSSMPWVADQKRAWVKNWIGVNTLVIPTWSRDKARYARPGDVLIDDWEKYKQLWLDAGGVWVTHISAIDTDRQLTELGL